MTKVATPGQLPASNALHFGFETDGGRGLVMTNKSLKRKTPSELRGELLRKKSLADIADEAASLTSVLRNADERFYGPQKCDTLKGSRCTRMDEHYPVTKINRLLSRKENNPKEAVSNQFFHIRLDSSVSGGIGVQNQELNSCPMQMETVTSGTGNDSSNLSENSLKRFNSSSFKSITELSLGGENLGCSSSLNMSIALKGLVSHEPHVVLSSLKESTDVSGNISPESFCSELHVPGRKSPLDLTLKTNVRLVSSSSVKWVHRLINCATPNYMPLFVNADSKPTSTSQITSSGNIHSWLYPQFTLPREAISALASAPGDFLSKRQQSWEDSFRSLYYMLRKKICRIFYVCSTQFVVMFALSDCPNQTKSSCHAYIPQSTRTLRSLLKQHDVNFSMPLCFTKVEEATAEDLVELSEIEKHNLGQTRNTKVVAGVDNTSQSLLMFMGHKNVHALYDFLLNYRSCLTSLSAGDVPVLISPVPFENAALSAPEVKCKQVRRVDYMSVQNGDSDKKSSAGICYNVEFKDTFIPPWVICGICDTMRVSGAEFHASFATEPMSNGLNIAMDQIPEPAKEVDDNAQHFGISNTNLSLRKHAACLKGLNYCDGSYTAFLSPLEQADLSL